MPPADSATETANLTPDQLRKAVGDNYQLLLDKVQNGIRFKLCITLHPDEVSDLVNEMVMKMLERHDQGKITFTDQGKMIGYVLFGAWCNYRTLAGKGSNAAKSKRKIKDQELMEEGSQKTFKTQIMNFDSYAYAPFIADDITTAACTEQDLRDDYYAKLYTLLFDYLDDCVADGFFKFDEVSLYKSYILNDWTLKELVEQSEYKRTYVKKAVYKIRDHIKSVDWYLKPQE